MADHTVRHVALASITEQVLHEDLGAEMGEAHFGTLDVALDELMPAVVRHTGVVVAARAEVNDVLLAKRDVEQAEGWGLAEREPAQGRES